MGSNFIIIAVLATIAQISLGGQPPKKSKISVDVDRHSTIPQDKSRPVVTCYFKGVTNAERNAVVASKRAAAMIYIATRVKVSDVIKKRQSEGKNGNSTTDCEATDGNSIHIFADLMQEYYNGIRAADRDADPIIRKVQPIANRAADEAVVAVQNAIALIGKECSSKVLRDWEQNKNTTITKALVVTDNVYEPLMSNRNSFSPLGAKIISARTITKSLVVKAFENMYEVIKQVLLQVCRHHNSKGSDCFLSLDSDEVRTFNDFQTIVQSVFNAIGDVLKACCGHPRHIYKRV